MSLFDYFSPKTQAPQQSAVQGNSAPSTDAGASNTAVQAQQSGGGGVMGMFHSAGAWMSEKWHDTTAAVGGAMDRVGTVAKDVWDVAKTTHVGWQDGQLTVDTDLDEVMDLMPQKARDALQLDRNGAENRIRLQFDHTKGTLTASSDDLAIDGVNTDKLQTGKVHLHGAKLTLSNPGGGLPFLDGGFSALGYHDKPDNLNASLSMDAMEAEKISIAGKDGPIRVDGLQTGALNAHASSEGGLPFADKGNTSAGFSVEKAVLHGVAGAGVGADEVRADKVEAGISEASESAFLETSGLGLKGAKQGDLALGDATVDNARIDVRNKGGGAVFLDDAADHIEADIAVSAAGVHDFKGQGTTVGEASLAKFRALYNQDASTLSAEADSARVSDVNVGTAAPATAKTAPESANPLHWSAGLGSLQVDRVRAGDASVGSANVRDLRASGDLSNKATPFKASLGSATVDDLHAKGLDAAHLSAEGANATLNGANLDATLAHARVDQARVADRLSVGTGTVDNLALGVHGDTRTASVGSAHVEKARDTVSGTAVGSADLAKLALTQTGDKVDATLGHLGVQELASAQLNAARLSADQGAVHLNGSNVDASLGSATLSSARILDRATVDQASASDLSLGLHGDHKTARLGSAEVSGIRDDLTHTSVDQADITALSAKDDAGKRELHFGDAGLDGLRVQAKDTTSTLAHLRATDGTVRQDALGTHATLATAAASDVHHGEISMGELATRNASVDLLDKSTLIGADGVQIDALSAPNFAANRLAAEGARVQLAGNDSTAHLDHASVDQATVADRLSINRATAEGIDANQRGDRRGVTVSAAHLENLKDTPTGTTVGTGDLADLRLSRDASTTSAGLGSLRAKDLGVHGNGTDASVSSLLAENATARLDTHGTQASLGHLSTTDARFSQALGTTSHGSPAAGSTGPGIDTGTLVRTLAARVDDADLSVHAPLNAGDYKSLHMGVDPGTVLDATATVRDGAFDRTGTRATLNHPLDAPLWVSVAGAYMNDKDQLMADVHGWKDQNVSEILDKSLGIPGKSMPNVATLGDAVGRTLDAPSTGTPAKKESGPGAADIVDLDHVNANARVSLNAGTIDAGPAGNLTLARGQKPGDNTLNAQLSGRDQIVASFADLLSSAFNVNAAGAQIQGGPAEIQDARLKADLQGSDARVDGSLGQADLRDLQIHAPTVIPTPEAKKKAAGLS